MLIFGNGGTGKTWLARKLGAAMGRPIVHLDDLRWLPGQFGIARDKHLVFNEVVRNCQFEEQLDVRGVSFGVRKETDNT